MIRFRCFGLVTLLPVLLLHAQETMLPSGVAALRHIAVLADDSLEGRAAGTPGGERAASYIESQMRAAGLRPAGTTASYRQQFSFLARVEAGPANRFSFSSTGKIPKRAANRPPTPFAFGTDYRIAGISASGTLSSGVVFAGYGISAPAQAYDDYEGIDVTGKTVIVLRYNPDGDTPHSTLNPFNDLFSKAQKAKEHGAVAIIAVNGSAEAPEDSLPRLQAQREQGRAPIPVLYLKRSAADRMLAGTGLTIDSLQRMIIGPKKPHSLPIINVSISLTADLKEITASAENVMGVLPGSDPSLRSEYVVIGAHYDHLGYGGQGSGSLAPDVHAIHNGADDNASGVGGLLELARVYSNRKPGLRRSVLFIAFSGEENGLLGSSAYVKTPVIPNESTAVMLNMDMIGRMHNRTVIVYGMGTAPGFDSLVVHANTDGLTLKLNKDGFGPSDHSSFYARKIPVMHFFTDLHSDYHRPSDDVQFIHADSLEPVLRLIDRIAMTVGNAPSRPTYTVAEVPKPQGQSSGFRVWVGTIPDYGEQTDGMRISGVSANSPAEKAGLQAGDVLVKFGKVDIKNVYDYTYALGEYKPGDQVDLVVMRGTERKVIAITLERRNR